MFRTFVGHAALHTTVGVTEPITQRIGYALSAWSLGELPSPDRIMDMAIRGWLRIDVAELWLEAHGIFINVSGTHTAARGFNPPEDMRRLWNQEFFAHQELPSPVDLNTLLNRGLINEGSYDQYLRRLGFYSDQVRGIMSNLRYEIPGSSDLVRFSVRHVFEPDLIERLGYNDEFRPILDFWHRLQGLNYPLFSGPFAQQIGQFEQSRGLAPGSFLRSYADRGLQDPTWAQAFWWSHWVVPSATQAYEMYFRFRPGRNHAFDPPGTEGLNFTGDDLNLLLRANDYPPSFRALLAGIAHRIPGIRFLRQLRSTQTFTQADVKELLLRQGYSDGDASILAESVERNDVTQRRRGIEQQAKGQLAKYWEQGTIDRAGYRDLLIQHGLTPDDADQTVALAELDLKFKRLEKIIDFVKRKFISGAINAAQATDQLRQAGIVQERIALYVEDWALDITVKHKQISAQKAQQWACKALITIDELRKRLGNLGYLAPDVDALVAEAQACQVVLAARAANLADRQARQTQRQLVQQQRAAAQAIVAARRQLAAHGSPSQLRKWFCAGHIGSPEVYSRLRFLGWPDPDITRLISDCKASTGSGSGGQRGGSVLGGQPVSSGPTSGGGAGG